MWRSLWWVPFSGWSDPSAFPYWVQWSWKSIRYNWWRPSRINEARKSGQPHSLASHEAIGGGDGTRAVCDVHAWTWGFRVMVCVYPSAMPHKLRTSLSDPDTGPTAIRRRSLQRIECLFVITWVSQLGHMLHHENIFRYSCLCWHTFSVSMLYYLRQHYALAVLYIALIIWKWYGLYAGKWVSHKL